ncbi:MAG: hypothetical protein KAQ69_01030, partial [Spirochaetales bacterium]|nr:hypothetical protein [Spirochaetales bacterium]
MNNKKKTVFLISIPVLVFILSLVVAGCDLFNFDKPATPKSWTIMVWLDGDNNLDNAAKEDFHEMEAGLYAAIQSDPDIQDHLNIIIQYDGLVADSYGRFVIQPRDIDPDGDVSNLFYGKISDSLTTEPNMGDAYELQDFIQYTKSNYPADHYALILWNHGGGVRSISSSTASREICQDETSGDYLYIGEIKDVLIETDSVDFLGMDACLMGMTEIAYEFRPGIGDFGAQTMTFSPAEEQGDGWEYQKIINRFRGTGYLDETGDVCFNIEDLTAADFARIIAKEYEDAFSELPGETQTAVDLTKISAVKSTVDELAGLLADDPSYKGAVEDIRGSGPDSELMHYFDISSRYEWENYASFDLYDLAWRIRENPVFTDIIQDKADKLMIVIEDA